MEDDVSKNTVVVLLILTIIISVVGTLVVLEEASRVRSLNSGNSEFSAQEQSPQLGIIKVNVQKRPAEFGASAEETAEETG